MDLAIRRSSARLTPTIVSDSFEFLRAIPGDDMMVTFQIPIGLPPADSGARIVSRPVDTRDLPPGLLYLAQLRGRALPVAAANFARPMERVLQTEFGATDTSGRPGTGRGSAGGASFTYAASDMSRCQNAASRDVIV